MLQLPFSFLFVSNTYHTQNRSAWKILESISVEVFRKSWLFLDRSAHTY